MCYHEIINFVSENTIPMTVVGLAGIAWAINKFKPAKNLNIISSKGNLLKLNDTSRFIEVIHKE